MRHDSSYIGAKEQQIDLVNVKYIAADTTSAVGVTIEQETVEEMYVRSNKIAPVIHQQKPMKKQIDYKPKMKMF